MSAAPKAVTTTVDNRLVIRTRPADDVGVPKVRQVHGPIMVVVQYGGRQGGVRWKAKNAMATWGATYGDGRKSLGYETSGREGDVSIDDEGIVWIRGHHAQDSKEVKALLVAYALRGGE